MKNIVKSIAIVLVLFFGVLMFAASNNTFGIRSFIVKSGSMEPTIATGSLVVTTQAHPTTLQKNDVITFVRPTEERDFITHRITQVSNSNDYVRIQTKGDNNARSDNWEVSGGNVIGKVAFTIPYLGYVLSFIQSKLGILLFILIPAIFILVEEVTVVINLFRKRNTAKFAPQPVEASVLVCALLFGLSAISISPTQALLTDTTTLTNNHFTVTLAPTAIPSPTTTCGGNTVINVSGNGAGSTTNVSVTNNCQTSILNSGSNISRTTNTIKTNTSTEINDSSFNTVTSVITETKDIETTVSVTTVGSSNSANVLASE